MLRNRGFRVVEAALWHEATQLTLTQPTPASTSCTVLPEDGAVKAGAERWKVEAVRLDSLSITGARLLVKLDYRAPNSTLWRGWAIYGSDAPACSGGSAREGRDV